MTQWIQGQVTNNHFWNDQLFSLKVKAAIAPHQAGQFIKLAFYQNDQRIARAYSFVNPPETDEHEFLIVEIENGALTPHLKSLKSGDSIWLSTEPQGYLTIDELPDGQDLWLLATGTGLGPFLAILQQDTVWHRFAKVALVHGVRHSRDLAYQRLIEELSVTHPLIYLPIVTREPDAPYLQGRIPALLANGELEKAAGIALNTENSQLMLCGNPQMVKDAITELKLRGFSKNLRRKPGQITAELYW